MLYKKMLYFSTAVITTVFLTVAISPLFVSANHDTKMLENEVRREQIRSNGLALLLYIETKGNSSFPSSSRWAHGVLTWAKQHKRNDICKLLKFSSDYEINPKLMGRSLDGFSKAERAEMVLLSEKSYRGGCKWQFYMDDHFERVQEQ